MSVNNWKPIETAPKDVIIQTKKEGGIPVTVLISSKYGDGYPQLLNECGASIPDGIGGVWTVLADYWREIEL